MQEREIVISDIYQSVLAKDGTFKNGQEVHLEGWVRTNRDNGSIGFIEFNDGSFFKNAQIIYTEASKDMEFISHISTGSAIAIDGIIVFTPENKQPFEISADEIKVLGGVEEGYSLQKKRHSFEFLRDIAHLRPRTNTFNAVYRVRSSLSFAIHKYFNEHGFIYIHTPIITANDAEGAGEAFSVITDLKHPDAFFNKNASLTVSGQLHVEPFALAYRNVYTFGPTFRAEKSNTTKHAAEFWMIEPEIAFADLEDNMELIEDCLKYVINYVLVNNKDEMEFFNQFVDHTLLERLNNVVNSKFKKIEYSECVKILQDAVKAGVSFDNSNIYWGLDFQSEHEKYITEQVVKGPVFVTNFPEEMKAFYMRLNDDKTTVAACDLLVPGVGELVGGSQREERLELLEAKMKKIGNKEELEWYLDTRRYGGCKHAGFGIGFDRLIMYVTGVNNIRDVQPYQRTFGSLKY
ncbi:MAG: asparagine--tRNA ligase [Bacilli bacterium]